MKFGREVPCASEHTSAVTLSVFARALQTAKENGSTDEKCSPPLSVSHSYLIVMAESLCDCVKISEISSGKKLRNLGIKWLQIIKSLAHYCVAALAVQTALKLYRISFM